jgi:hypothetical protein
VKRFESENLEEKQIEGSLDEVGRFAHGYLEVACLLLVSKRKILCTAVADAVGR